MTDDVDWSTDAAIESAPWYGPRHGKEGVRESAEMHLHHYWRFRDGKVSYVRSSEDTALVAATLQPLGESGPGEV